MSGLFVELDIRNLDNVLMLCISRTVDLETVDPVAYVRFASVYREFKDVNTFMDELKRVLDK